MPDLYFIVFEVVIYIQFGLYLRHAWEHGSAVIPIIRGHLHGQYQPLFAFAHHKTSF